MPKRSNPFQNLVFLIKQQVSPGSIVTESKFLRDLVTDQDREVDICIETEVSSHSLIISVECIDRKRRADVAWVEAMKTKHERLPTNLLVLVSRNGFSAQAIQKAQSFNIRTVTLDEAVEDVVVSVFKGLDTVWCKVMWLFPKKVLVRVAQTDALPADELVVLPDDSVHSATGGVLGVFNDLLKRCLESKVGDAIANDGTPDHKSFRVGWPNPRGVDGQPLYALKEPSRVLRQIEAIEVRGRCKFEVSPFPLKHGILGDVKVSWGSGQFMGKKAILLASQTESQTPQISITIKE